MIGNAISQYELPAVMGLLTNVGLALPGFVAERMAPWRVMIGGHGSADTQAVVMAIQGPEIARARILSDPSHQKNHRLADIAVTLASMWGLELKSTTVGCDRSAEVIG